MVWSLANLGSYVHKVKIIGHLQIFLDSLVLILSEVWDRFDWSIMDGWKALGLV